MNAFYYRSESVELSGDESPKYSCDPSEELEHFGGSHKPHSVNCLPTRAWDRFVDPDQACGNFCIQRPPSERFEVVPMLCQVKRISHRHAQSENGVSLASHRSAHGARFSMISSSSAPPRGSAKPGMEGRSERCRQLERTVRDQEKIITLLENELHRTRPRRKQTPLRGRMRSSMPMRGESAPSLPCGLSGNSSVFSSIDASHLHGCSSPPQQPLQPRTSVLPPGAPADLSSVPVLARRVRSLVREIREETEASLLRHCERSQPQQEQY